MRGPSIRQVARLACLVAGWTLAGCAAPGPVLIPARDRAFDFERDTFSFLNEVEYKYRIDVASRSTEKVGRNPDAEYVQRCFAMARTARLFMQFARFDPASPKLDEDAYRKLISRLLSHDPSEQDTGERIVFPGYANLRAFSQDHEGMVKDAIGGHWVTYYWQRGHWRIMFPFTDRHQSQTAENLLAEIRVHRPPVVHLITFPEVTINHGVLLFDAQERNDRIDFSVYDPNNSQPTRLTFDRRTGRFEFARQFYFAGGPVDVYQVYTSTFY